MATHVNATSGMIIFGTLGEKVLNDLECHLGEPTQIQLAQPTEFLYFLEIALNVNACKNIRSIFTVYVPNEEFHRTEYDVYIHEHRFHFLNMLGLIFL